MKITVETNVAAPLEQVWRAYTTPEHIKQWNAASAVVRDRDLVNPLAVPRRATRARKGPSTALFAFECKSFIDIRPL
jgi:uncharacterized protein YndB with AHSA1/START domain